MTYSRSALIAFGAIATILLAFTVFGWPRSSSAGGLDIVVDTSAGGANNHDGECSLGEAITAANNDTQVSGCIADETSDTITFNLNPGDTTINVTTALPNITSPVTINGDLGGGGRVELAGGTINANGLTIASSNVVIRNLVINDFGRLGIRIVSGVNTQILGNLIGTNVAGDGALANAMGGIEVDASNSHIGGSEGTTPGGSCTGDCNVISGNGGPGIEFKSAASSSTVVGNFIGTDVSGTAAVPNQNNGVLNNGDLLVIGGTDPVERNVISGNTGNGVSAGASFGTTVSDNFIGTTSAGTAPLGNSGAGVYATGFLQLGSSTGGTGNLISGNGTYGVDMEPGADGSQVMRNFIGTNASGNSAIGNSTGGLYSKASGAMIGGTLAGEGNLISGNLTDVILEAAATLQGNKIGTNAAGTAALYTSGGDGVRISSGAGTVVGGTTPGSRNIISGHGEYGLSLLGNSILVQGNYIGTNGSGNSGVPNEGGGVYIQGAGNTIGGSAAGAGNLISGHTTFVGIQIQGAGATGNVIQGNLIGTKADGVSSLGNGNGIHVCCMAADNTIGGTGAGEGNTIAFNVSDGVYITTAQFPLPSGISIRGNSIHDNGFKGIEIQSGGNDGITPPTITAQNPLTGMACGNCKVDIYSDAADEGRKYEGTVTTNGTGVWSFGGAVTGPNVTATNTDLANNTSEFSAPFAYTGTTATPSPTPSPTPTGQTASPTASGQTASPTPTPTPTGQVSATPTQTPGPSQSATPTTPPEGWHQGDANCSGTIDIGDVTTLLKKFGGLPVSAGCPAEQDNVNCDAAVGDALDALGDLLYLVDAGSLPTPSGCAAIGDPIQV